MNATADGWSSPLLIAFVAGLFALLGAFAGAWLTRKTEHQKWLRQSRAEAYTKFLELLSKAHIAATDIMFDRSIEELQQNIKVTEAYMPAMDCARIVRLYLPPERRQEFSDLSHGYFVLHSQRSLGDSRLTTMGQKLQKIQQLFEETLDS
jgi:hypothetical protein